MLRWASSNVLRKGRRRSPTPLECTPGVQVGVEHLEGQQTLALRQEMVIRHDIYAR
jgi:hypothetical protein